MDLQVAFPAPGRIHVRSRELFRDPSSPTCARLIERLFRSGEVTTVAIHGGESALLEIGFDPQAHPLKEVVAGVAQLLRNSVSNADGPGEVAGDGCRPNGSLAIGDYPAAPVSVDAVGQAHSHPAIHSSVNQHIPAQDPGAWHIAAPIAARDRRNVVRMQRIGKVATGWKVRRESPGRIKLHNPVIFRKKDLTEAIERELMSVLGVDKYACNTLTCHVTIDYDPRQLEAWQLIEILDQALANAEHPEKLDKLDLHLPICTAAIPIAAVAQFAAPPLLPAAAALFAYTSIPSFQGAYEVVFKEKRLGVDVLDAIVVVGCLGTMSIFPGAMLCWCLSFGRVLVKKTRDDSRSCC
ncbi:MAG: hypothetical protein U0800_11230 [Isosphaeraceae bacterium]